MIPKGLNSLNSLNPGQSPGSRVAIQPKSLAHNGDCPCAHRGADIAHPARGKSLAGCSNLSSASAGGRARDIVAPFTAGSACSKVDIVDGQRQAMEVEEGSDFGDAAGAPPHRVSAGSFCHVLAQSRQRRSRLQPSASPPCVDVCR